MIPIEIIKKQEKEGAISQLNKQYGISKIPGLFLRTGKEKIRILTSDIRKEELLQLKKILNIEFLGLYIIKKEYDGLRLSHDAPDIFKEQISKNIFKADDKQAIDWLKGQDILLSKEQEKTYKEKEGFVVIENKDNLIGCGKLGKDFRIRNFVPKERRLRN